MNSLSFSEPNLLNPEAIEWPLNSVLKINMVKYDAVWEIMNTYENLQKVQCQFFTDKVIFIYIWSKSKISIGLSVFRFIANQY